jgi:chromate transport protein ChrA
MRSATRKSTKTKDERKAREKAFKKLMAVSAVCTIALLAQAVFLLWSSATSAAQTDEARFYGILTFLYLTEIPPAVIFVIMFKKASAFIKGERNSATSATMSGTAGDNTAPLNASLQSQSADDRE